MLRREYGDDDRALGRAQGLHDDLPGVQRAAQAAIKPCSPTRTIRRLRSWRSIRTRGDPGDDGGHTGQKNNKFNFVSSARRQPGSTFKDVVLTTAVAEGIDPDPISYLSAPFHYQPDPTCNPADPNCAWDVQTYDHSYLGATSIENATVQSDNTVFARLILDVGPEKVVQMASKLGVRSSPLDACRRITLGSIGVSPLEMASAYSTLAAGGVYSKPMAITRVVLAERQGRHDAGGASRTASVCISDGSPMR